MANKFKFQDIIDVMHEDGDSPNYVDDGIYDVSNCQVIIIFSESEKYLDAHEEDILYFEANATNLHVAEPYQSGRYVLLSDKPVEITTGIFGTGFNYGSCNLIQDCPSSILILAEDD